MKGLSTGAGLAAGVAVALGLLLLPATAGASRLPPAEEADAPPGITITGIGFARLSGPPGSAAEATLRASDAAHPVAVARSVRDARRRAAAIAQAVGVQLGEIEQVELRELSQFGEPRPCNRREAKGSPRCHGSRLTAAATTATFAIVGGASGAGLRTVRVHGRATAAVEASDPQRNRSIRLATLASRRAVTPKAAATARRNARNAAHSAGLTLGPIVSISEAPPFYYGPSFYDAALGAFGPGQFCGLVSRPIVRRDPDTGTPRVVRRVRQRRCLASRTYSLTLEISYEGGR